MRRYLLALAAVAVLFSANTASACHKRKCASACEPTPVACAPAPVCEPAPTCAPKKKCHMGLKLNLFKKCHKANTCETAPAPCETVVWAAPAPSAQWAPAPSAQWAPAASMQH